MIPIPPPGYGAVEKHIWHLGEALRGLGHEVDIVNRVVGTGSLDEYRFAWDARRVLRAGDHDIVHAHTTGVAATLATFGPPFVYTSHSRHWMSVEGWNERAGFTLERFAVGRAREVIALTEDVARAMGDRASPHIIPNGVDAEEYRPSWDARNGRTILCLGVVTRHKGFHIAAEAARDLDADVRVVGPIVDPGYADELEGLGAIVTGPVDLETLQRELAEADIFCHLSMSEAFSLAVLEAMASGLPLVASDVCRGQVFDGGNGTSIPVALDEDARVAATRAALEGLLGDDGLRRRQAERSRAIVLENYTWAKIASRVVEVYRRASDNS